MVILTGVCGDGITYQCPPLKSITAGSALLLCSIIINPPIYYYLFITCWKKGQDAHACKQWPPMSSLFICCTDQSVITEH